MLSIWAVVPTHNRPGLALQTLASLVQQTVSPAGIILVDHGSPSHIGELARRRLGDLLTVLRREENLGPAAGFAAGIRLAMQRQADWVWLLDDDSWPLSTALEELVHSAAFCAADTVALCSLKQDAAGNLQKWEARLERGRLRTPKEDAYSSAEFEVDAAGFAGLLLRTTALARVGLPDPRYFGRFADYQFCLRLRPQGRIFCVPASRLVHEDDGSRLTCSVNGHCRPRIALFLSMCLGLRNQAYYFFREAPALVPFLQVASHFGRMAGGVLLWDDSKTFRLAVLLRAFFDGLRGRLGPFPAL